VWFCAGNYGRALQIRNDGSVEKFVLRKEVARVQAELW
jgi:hypothetical protein